LNFMNNQSSIRGYYDNKPGNNNQGQVILIQISKDEITISYGQIQAKVLYHYCRNK
jgi:hypothetical protein